MAVLPLYRRMEAHARLAKNPSALSVAFRRPQHALQNCPSSLELGLKHIQKHTNIGLGAPVSMLACFWTRVGPDFEGRRAILELMLGPPDGQN